MAWKMRDGFFNLEDAISDFDELLNNYPELSFEAGKIVINVVYKFVSRMVNSGDDDGLTVFQEMLRQILKRASECRQQGLKMTVPFEDEDEDNEDGWQLRIAWRSLLREIILMPQFAD